MGAENNAMLPYLEDDKRFADLFNQLYFKGQQVVDAEELAEASEVYHGKPGEKGGQRTRDIKRRLKSGKELKILAVERCEPHHALAYHGIRLSGIWKADTGSPEGEPGAGQGWEAGLRQ